MSSSRRAAVLVAVVALPPAVIVGAIVAAFAGLFGAVVFVVLAGGIAAWVWTGAERRVLDRIGGSPADPGRDARPLNLIEGLSFTAGLHPPALRVLPGDGLNVAVVGRQRDSSTIVVTSGLLAELTRIELEGVLAAALVEIRAGELGPATVAASLPGLGRRLVSSAPGRDAATDLAAVGLTRFPPGLAGALDKMDAKGTTVSSASVDQAHLWLADPLPGGPGAVPAGAVRTALRARAEALREL